MVAPELGAKMNPFGDKFDGRGNRLTAKQSDWLPASVSWTEAPSATPTRCTPS